MDDVQAESSPAAPVAAPISPDRPTDVLASLSDAELSTWRQTGEIPHDKIVVSADSPPAEPVEQAALTDASSKPASEPATPKKNRDTRIEELLTETKRLKEQLAATRLQEPAPAQDVKPAASSPAPAAETFPTFADYLVSHPDASHEAWLDARDDWRDERKEAQARARADADTLTRSQEERARKFSAQVEDQAKADPDFLANVSPDVLALRPISALKPGEAAGPLNIVGAELMNSPVAPLLMRYWTEHPEELRRLSTVPAGFAPLPSAERAREHVRWIVREIGKTEAKLEAAGTPASPTTKTVSDAPDPGTTLGTRPAGPADALEAAVRRQDPGAYIREANARELAARKR